MTAALGSAVVPTGSVAEALGSAVVPTGSVAEALGAAVVSPGLQSTGSVAVVHGLGCSVAHGSFPDQGLNPSPLHWHVDSLPVDHQGSPNFTFNQFKFNF